MRTSPTSHISHKDIQRRPIQLHTTVSHSPQPLRITSDWAPPVWHGIFHASQLGMELKAETSTGLSASAVALIGWGRKRPMCCKQPAGTRGERSRLKGCHEHPAPKPPKPSNGFNVHQARRCLGSPSRPSTIFVAALP